MNNFRVQEKLGEGTFSVVHKVQRKSDDQYYALKKMKLGSLSHKQIGNCLNEVRILASIHHPNVVSYKEAFFDDITNSLCVVTELANEGDLLSKVRSRARKSSYFEEEEIWRVFVQSLRGLDYLHSLKILHRDIKSANIFIANGIVKIGDLNVSTVLKHGMARTQTGTPFYVSPQIWNNSSYDSKSDIWSLGCVIYEMAALKPPFQATKMAELSQKVIKGCFDRIPGRYSEDLASLIYQCLRQRASERPSCHSLLKSQPVRSRTALYGLSESLIVDGENKSTLLDTIRPPKRMKQLNQKLPESNYEGRSRASSCNRKSLPRQKEEDIQNLHPNFNVRSQRVNSAVVRSLAKKESRKELNPVTPQDRMVERALAPLPMRPRFLR